jgi:hypothetical protein
MLLFVSLYVLATRYYPGGSKAHPAHPGFDWINNYWCDLTDSVAKNGSHNAAQPIALAAMFILCSALAMFWLQAPRLFVLSKYNRLIQIAGVGAMLVTLFLFTSFHDTVIHVGGLLGIVALVGAFHGLRQNKQYKHFWFGVFCMFLMLVNYFIYETGWMLSCLAILQKVTFALFLAWVCWMNWGMLGSTEK